MDILGQIANPQMANIAQAIDIRQQRVKEQQDALAKVEMGARHCQGFAESSRRLKLPLVG